MPRAYRTRASRPPLTEPARRWFLHGEKTERDTPGAAAYFEAKYVRPRELWLEHRDELLEEFIAAHPGERPNGWWLHEAPHGIERLKVSGSGERGGIYHGEGLWGYLDCDPEDPPCIESVPALLKRLGLLQPGEERRIPKRAWLPERLDVDGEGWAPGSEAA
jgi:hypothetical protein